MRSQAVRTPTPSRPITLAVSVGLIAILACNGGRTDETLPDFAHLPTDYAENDTLRIDTRQTPNLSQWLGYYGSRDTSFRLNRFRSSGVILHFDSLATLPPADSNRMAPYFPLLAWSPNGSRAIDCWSYGLVMEKDKDGMAVVSGGGPDQQVTLWEKRTGSRYELLFNGPESLVESADWVDENAFLLGRMDTDGSTGEAQPMIILFNLSDSTFLDFRFEGRIGVDGQPDFLTPWLERKGLRVGGRP